ncbi:MAG: hypothetical protein M3271_06595 [Actinomycetota bacterium]|nr:hypothetical protein [Actinomycetota bacterium]
MRSSWDKRRVIGLALALLLAGACSSPQGTPAENSLLGKDEGKASGGNAKKKPDAKRPKGKTETGAAAMPTPGLAAPAPGETGPANSGAAKTETKVTSTGTDPRDASVLVTEPDPDAEKSGLAPEYGDIVSTRVEGLATELRVTINLRADVPDRMPDDKTYMVAGFGVTGKGDDTGYAFGASADQSGWKAYGGHAKDEGKYPGELSISGATMVFTLPWSAIDGPRPFKWYSQASWFKSLAGTTHYSLDMLPNDGPARFPAG